MCALCGVAILAGDIAREAGFTYNFTDYAALAARTNIACGACARMMTRTVMRRLQKVVVSKEGVYPLTKDAYRAWFFLTPPALPYVAVVGTTQLQHLIWRTPVTLDDRIQIVRVGSRLLRIRRCLLRQGLEAARRIADALGAAAPTRRPPLRLRHPFSRLDRELASLAHGRFRPETAALCQEYAADIAELSSLGTGELWAMACLAKRYAPVPRRPPPVDFADLREES